MNYRQILTTALLLNLILPAAFPCASTPPQGKIVQILQESAVIIWDPKTKTQHFIRSAAFDSDSPDFGFLVPTPNVPQLYEAPQTIFTSMQQWTAPEIVDKVIHGVQPFFFFSLFFMLKSAEYARVMSTAPPSVRVLSSQQVSGFDAVVLEADNADVLQKWLDENHYAIRPELVEWVNPYIEKKWKISAFKIANATNGEAFATAPVRMTFETERPFFPYREPSDQGKESGALPARLLQMYLLSDQRLDAVLGNTGAWPGRTNWSDRLAQNQRDVIAKELSLDSASLPPKLWMTAMEDISSPRPGTEDLFFFASKDQSRLLPPPIENEIDRRVPLPVDLLLLLMVGAILIVRRKRRRKIVGSTK